jgi:hypothetical protein
VANAASKRAAERTKHTVTRDLRQSGESNPQRPGSVNIGIAVTPAFIFAPAIEVRVDRTQALLASAPVVPADAAEVPQWRKQCNRLAGTAEVSSLR